MSDENDPLSVCCRHLANSQHIIEEKNAEIASLRLTDEEREAIEFVVDASRAAPHATLRKLLERLHT